MLECAGTSVSKLKAIPSSKHLRCELVLYPIMRPARISTRAGVRGMTIAFFAAVSRLIRRSFSCRRNVSLSRPS